LEVFSAETLQGHWKQLTVRCGLNTGQLMLIVGFTNQDLSPERLDEIKEDLRTFFTTGQGTSLNVTSLYFQKLDRT
jgi:tRNA (uracil-5-)-methyltransferase